MHTQLRFIHEELGRVGFSIEKNNGMKKICVLINFLLLWLKKNHHQKPLIERRVYLNLWFQKDKSPSRLKGRTPGKVTGAGSWEIISSAIVTMERETATQYFILATWYFILLWPFDMDINITKPGPILKNAHTKEKENTEPLNQKQYISLNEHKLPSRGESRNLTCHQRKHSFLCEIYETVWKADFTAWRATWCVIPPPVYGGPLQAIHGYQAG